MKYDIIFLGGGQAGVFGAYEAVEKKDGVKVLVIDKGRMLKNRVCPKETLGNCVNCPTCSIIYGVSGAGAFSDSKFNMDYRVGGDVHTVTGKKVVNDTIQYVVDIYRKFGFNEEPAGLNYNATMEKIKKGCIENGIQLVDTPTMHLGTDGSRKLYSELIDYLLSKGVEFVTEREIESLIVEDEKIKGVVVTHKGAKEEYYSDNVVIGMGRSGAQKMMDLCKEHNIKYENGAIDIGVRAEIPDIIMKEINENFYEAKMIYLSLIHI